MSLFKREGRVRTNLWCHECRNDFSADLEYDLDGNHEVHCPHCDHVHYRVIQRGRVTDERYRSSVGPTWNYAAGGSGTTGRVYVLPASTTTTAVWWVA